MTDNEAFLGSQNRTKDKQVAQVTFLVQEKACISRTYRRLGMAAFVHIEDVSGSNPLSPTIIFNDLGQRIRSAPKSIEPSPADAITELAQFSARFSTPHHRGMTP